MADESEPRDQLGPWEASKQKFLRELSPEDEKQFRQWLNDGKSTKRIEDEVRALAEKNANFAKIKPFINGLNILDGLISSLAGLEAHGIVTLLWGSIKIFMTLATKAIKILESISELLDDVGQQLDLFHQYESLFSKHGSSRFNPSLQRVYSTYLYFFSTARNFYQSSGFRKVKESVGLTREKHSSHVRFALEEVKRACLQAKDEVELADRQSRAISDAQIADSVKQVDEEMHNMRLEVGKVGRNIGDMREEIGEKLAKVDYAEFRGWVRVEKLDMEDSLRTNLDKKKGLSPYWRLDLF
ncbi:nacht domain protein [Seiridium cupressi]